MVDYWQYRSVTYWLNVVKGKQTFCLDAQFFKTASVVVGRDELLDELRRCIPDDERIALESVSETYKQRLDWNDAVENILLLLWNAPSTREGVREILQERAQGWLEGAARDGVEAAPVPWPGAAVEAALCVERGMLVPPSPCADEMAKQAFLRLAVGEEIGEDGEMCCPWLVVSKERHDAWVGAAAKMVCKCTQGAV